MAEPAKLVQVLTLPTCILEVRLSNLSRLIDSPERGFSRFSQSLPQTPVEYLKLSHDHFLPHNFKFYPCVLHPVAYEVQKHINIRRRNSVFHYGITSTLHHFILLSRHASAPRAIIRRVHKRH
jgi:hypothetical protein